MVHVRSFINPFQSFSRILLELASFLLQNRSLSFAPVLPSFSFFLHEDVADLRSFGSFGRHCQCFIL